MKSITGALVAIIIVLISGCSDSNTLLVTQADFDRVTNSIFTSAEFTRRGGGSGGGGDEMEFSAIYEPKNPAMAIHLDLSAWETFLKTKDRFNGHGKGGSQGLYWRETWDNKARFIVVDSVVMKNGDIRVTYR